MVRSNTSRSRADEGPPFYENPRLDQLSAKTRAPRWSLGGRTKKLDEIYASKTPGPGAYSPTSKGHSPPSWSLYGRLDEKSTSFAPGPGAYSPDGEPRKRIAISLQSRHYMPDSGSFTPGPGQYRRDLPPSSPRWSLGGRLNDPATKLLAGTPGPAQYSPEKPKSARATLLHSRVREIDKRGNLPGPGAYGNPDMSRVKTKSPAYSLGGRPNTASLSKGPGPGNYNPEKKSTSLSFSMTPRREGDWSSTRANPGPGAYSPGSKGASPRMAGMGIGNRFLDDDPTKGQPGPGAYQPVKRNGAPAYSMTARRGGGSVSRLQPGPGAYSPKTDYVFTSSPRCTMHPRVYPPNSNLNTPGPDHYNAMRPNTAPAVTLKSRIEPKLGFVSPGPHYDVVGREAAVKPKSPSYSLGKRIGYAHRDQGPGPGQYETAFTFVRNHDQHF